MTPMRVDEAIAAIMDRAKELLEEATVEGELIAGVSIVRGDRVRSNPGDNTVWLVPDTATVDTTTHGLAEIWNLQVIIGAVVKEFDDPDLGFMNATALAAKAQQVLLGRVRRWNLDFIDHVTPVKFDPSTPKTANDKASLFWADAVINVSFRRLEPR